MKRTAFFISDGTGITVEGLGHSLLAQFETIEFEHITLPYIDTLAKAADAVERINQACMTDGVRPIVFDTIVNKEIRDVIAGSEGFNVDVFDTFLAPLEQEFGHKSSYTVGKTHSIHQNDTYSRRIEAVNYALDNDDGARTQRYDEADIILVGVSRSGKTPTCLYLALQYGVKAANYPITEEDMFDSKLPEALHPHRSKLFGLTIEPDRLALIRNERRPNSRYSSLKQCQMEVEEVEQLYHKERIPYLNSTECSIEEIATRIMMQTGLKRRTR